MTGGALRRIRADAAQLLLLAALATAATFMVTAAPRYAAGAADAGLRGDVAAAARTATDVYLESTVSTRGLEPAVQGAADNLENFGRQLPHPLSDAVARRWFAADIDGAGASGPAPPFNGFQKPVVGLRAQPGYDGDAALVAGRWPSTSARTARPVVEVAVSTAGARVLQADVGATFQLDPPAGEPQPAVPVRVVGIFTVADPRATPWDDAPLAADPKTISVAAALGTIEVTALTDAPGLAVAAQQLGTVRYTWRYRMAEQGITLHDLDTMLAAVERGRRQPVAGGVALRTSLDTVLARSGDRIAAAGALLAVVRAGAQVTLVGLMLLAARLAVARRREEYRLLRARGAAVLTVTARALTELLGVVLPGAALGWLAALAVPGRGVGSWWLVAAVTLLAVLAVPAFAALEVREPAVAGRDRELAAGRGTGASGRPRGRGREAAARRWTAEGLVVLLAALGVVLLRRRGLPTGTVPSGVPGGVDPYLAVVPVLVAGAAALVALRLLPGPLRLGTRLVARRRGAVGFLGLAGAARGAAVAAAPLAALVAAIATGVFSAAVASSVHGARDRGADWAVGADLRLDGMAFAAGTADRMAGVEGVTAVSAVTTELNVDLRGRDRAGTLLGTTQLLVVDPVSYARVLSASGAGGADGALPAALTRAAAGQPPGSGPVPAVVSRGLAGALRDGAVLTVQSHRYEIGVAAVVEDFPGLGDARDFVILPAQALPDHAQRPLAATRFQVAGARAAQGRLREVAAAGQREYLAALFGGAGTVPEPEIAVTSWSATRAALDRTGANDVLTFTCTAGILAATGLGLLAIAFGVVAEARPRGQVLSRLRTLGLSTRQARGVLVAELVPLHALAALTGTAVGVALPAMLAPALGLAAFTGGQSVPVRVGAPMVAGVLGFVAAGLAVAVGTESMANRRLRLGRILRVGEGG